MPEEAEPTAEDQLADMQSVFDLRWDCDMRAIRRWQADTGRDFTWPDHTDLLVWLLVQLAAAEARIATLEEESSIQRHRYPELG